MAESRAGATDGNGAFSSDGPDQQRFILAQLRVMVGDVSFVVGSRGVVQTDYGALYLAHVSGRSLLPSNIPGTLAQSPRTGTEPYHRPNQTVRIMRAEIVGPQ